MTKVKGQWRHLHRAVDTTGQTIDFLLTEPRDERAATRFLIKAMERHGVPAKITIDGSGPNAAAIRRYNEDHGTAIIQGAGAFDMLPEAVRHAWRCEGPHPRRGRRTKPAVLFFDQ